MEEVLEIKFSGWTATPRMPFVLAGNALCLPTPSYSLLTGLIGCCIGRLVVFGEVRIGFYYNYECVAQDLETRQRLEFVNGVLKKHSRGTDVYPREFHVNPSLTIWIDRLDWEDHFLNPVGTPTLGRSQDLLQIRKVRRVAVVPIHQGIVSGCMLPFTVGLKVGGQLVQMAEAFIENDEIGSGRRPSNSGVFISIPADNVGAVKIPDLFRTVDPLPVCFYMHRFKSAAAV